MTTALTVNFDDDDYDVIDDAAWDHRMTKNELVRTAVNQFLQNSEQDEYPEITTEK